MNGIKNQPSFRGKGAGSRRLAYYFYLTCVAAALAASLILIASSSNAQSASAAPNAASRYSAADIERAFSLIDASRDGKISREEAARFRRVAEHFDAADTDKDSALSRQEFGNALNRP